MQSVKAKQLENGYGYIRVTQFQENTTQAVAKQMAELIKSGDLKGLVLDLRNDPGGLLNSAVGVSAAFLPPKALVVSTDGRVEDAKHKYFAVSEDYNRGTKDDALKGLPAAAKTVPMVVLVNSGSASASEIVAGALQDHKRAVVMGTQSFGKGSVQTVLPLPQGAAIKLTTARYYTPSGRSIQAKGIVPDIVVEETPNGESHDRIREADLERHLTNDKDKEAPKDAAKAKDSKDSAKDAPSLAPTEFGGKNDWQLTQAVNLLKGLAIMHPKVAPATQTAAQQ